MANDSSKKSGKIVTLLLMMLSLTTIYTLPYLMYTYYTPLQEAMGLVGQDAAYGKLLNVYGIANVILYIPGGWIADKFDAKKLLVFSMVATGALGIWESFFPSYTALMIIHILFAVTTVLTYWSSSIKCINVIAGANEQGTMFGSLESGRGIVGLIMTTIFVAIYTASASMSGVILTVSIVMIICGLLFAKFMPNTNVEGTTNESIKDSLKALGAAFKSPITYLLAGLIFTASMTKASTSYFAPYLENVCGMDVKITTIFANYNSTLTGFIGAAVAAICARKIGRSSTPMIFAGIILAASYVIMLCLPAAASAMYPLLIFMIIASLSFTVFRALYYAVIDEMGAPKNEVGTIIGIASILGFLPDTFYTTLCGTWLEKFGVGGYKNIFISCVCAAALGIVCSIISEKKIIKARAK